MTLTPEQIEEIAAYLRDATRSLSGEGYFLSAHALGQKFDALLSSHRELQERVDKLEKALREFQYYRAAFLAREYDIGSPLVARLFDSVDRLLTTKGQ